METDEETRNLRMDSFSSHLRTGKEKVPVRVRRTQRELDIFSADKYFSLDLSSEGGLQKEGPVALNCSKPNYTSKSLRVTDEGSSGSNWSGSSVPMNLNRYEPSFTPKSPPIASEGSSGGNQSGSSVARDLNCYKPKFKPTSPKNTSEENGENSRQTVLQQTTQLKTAQVGQKSSSRLKLDERSSTKKALLADNQKSIQKRRVSFPIPNSKTISSRLDKVFQAGKKVAEDPRMSLEVFGSDRVKNADIADELERKLSNLTWDAIPRQGQKKVSASSYERGVIYAVKGNSPESSGIENVSDIQRKSRTNPTTPVVAKPRRLSFSRDLEKASDFPSFVSYRDEKSIGISRTGMRAKNKGKMRKEVLKNPPRGLMGCNSRKAVTVAESAYKIIEKPRLKDLLNSLKSPGNN